MGNELIQGAVQCKQNEEFLLKSKLLHSGIPAIGCDVKSSPGILFVHAHYSQLLWSDLGKVGEHGARYLPTGGHHAMSLA